MFIHTGTYLLHCMFHVCISTKRKKHEPTHSENLTSGQIFFYNNKVYFGWSERTALIKNCSDRAYTLYTIHFTVYGMITPFWGKGGVDPEVTPPLGSGLSPREPMHLLILWLSLLRVLPYPLTLYLISDVEDIGIFYLEKWFILTINLIDSVSRNPQENFKYHSTNGGSLEIIFTFRITPIV